MEGLRLRMLLAKAKSLGGDRLTIDIAEAETAIRLFNKVEKSAAVIQVRYDFCALAKYHDTTAISRLRGTEYYKPAPKRCGTSTVRK